MEYKLEPAPCCYSTTEGEPEFYPNKGSTAVITLTLGQSKYSAPLHWCHDRRPHSGNNT